MSLTEAHRQSLLQAFNLREEDIVANRAGRLSERQKTWLAPPKVRGLVLLVIAGHMALIGGLLGAIALITGEPILFFVLLIVLGLGALPFMLIGREGIGRPVLQNDVQRGKVSMIQGTIVPDPDTVNRRYYVQVGDLRFKVTARVYGRFIANADYRLYYLPDSKTLLSAEPGEP